MKHFVLALLSLPTFFAIPLAMAEDIPFIEVRGTATEKAPVDRVTWTLRIRSAQPGLAYAAKSIDGCYQELKRDLEALEIPDLEFRSGGVTSGREYERTEKERKFVGFYAERGLSIVVTDLSKVNEVQARLLGDDRISVVSINRGSTKELDLKAQALVSAAKAARTKADNLAHALNFEIGRVLVVVDGGVSLGGSGFVNLTSNVIDQPVFSARDGVELDEVSITQSVTVKFAIAE